MSKQLQPQKIARSVTTQEKAQAITILNINRREAIVIGTTIIDGVLQDYVVSFEHLTCTCPAGRNGRQCKHVRACLTERARMAGYDETRFYDTRIEARRACFDALKAGRRSVVHAEGGYVYVSTDTRGGLPISRPDKYVLWTLVAEVLPVFAVVLYDRRGTEVGRFHTYTAADDYRDKLYERLLAGQARAA